MNEIKYNINNESIKEHVIEYITTTQDFKEALVVLEGLKNKFVQRGYNLDELKTWIDVEVNASKESMSYAAYARIQTPHTRDYEYVSANSSHNTMYVSNQYSKSRNTIGQQIINILEAEAAKIKEQNEQKRAILAAIVKAGEFYFDGKDYIISEKQNKENEDEENEDEENEDDE